MLPGTVELPMWKTLYFSAFRDWWSTRCRRAGATDLLVEWHCRFQSLLSIHCQDAFWVSVIMINKKVSVIYLMQPTALQKHWIMLYFRLSSFSGLWWQVQYELLRTGMNYFMTWPYIICSVSPSPTFPSHIIFHPLVSKAQTFFTLSHASQWGQQFLLLLNLSLIFFAEGKPHVPFLDSSRAAWSLWLKPPVALSHLPMCFQ